MISALANRQALLGELDAYLAELALLRAYLMSGDGPSLEGIFGEARDARNAWAENTSILESRKVE